MPPRYRTVGLGGTFDHFHRGHQHFITHAAQLGSELLIGVTNDKLIKHKPWSSSLQAFDQRLQAVKHFCRQHHIRAEVFELTEPIGPTLEGTRIQALCVTPETEQGASAINNLRLKLRMRPLPTYVAPYWKNQDGEVLHSVAIREGRLSAEGNNWWKVLDQSYILSDEQRLFWSVPQGHIVTSPTQHGIISAVVGDVCLSTFIERKWPYHLAYFDGKTQREINTVLHELRQQAAQISNPSGVISSELIESAKNTLPQESELHALRKKPHHTFINGEEDLAAVVLAMLLPLHSRIYYGQPNQGMVEMIVTPELKSAFGEQLNPNLPRS